MSVFIQDRTARVQRQCVNTYWAGCGPIRPGDRYRRETVTAYDQEHGNSSDRIRSIDVCATCCAPGNPVEPAPPVRECGSCGRKGTRGFVHLPGCAPDHPGMWRCSGRATCRRRQYRSTPVHIRAQQRHAEV